MERLFRVRWSWSVAMMLAVLSLAVPSSWAWTHRVRDFRGHNFHLHLEPVESTPTNYSNVQEKYFDEAVVDHFAPLSERKTWKQRYFLNEEFWAGHGYPVFISIGGEGPLGPRSVTNRTFMHYLAQQHRALLVALEHRYYGKSYPTEDMSLPNMRFLSSEQALADLARFHAFLSSKYGLEESKWVAFGGSYPGSLAAWAKLKYPALFVGSIASSAPILAKSNFEEYMEVVGDGLRFFGGGQCYGAVETAINELRKLLDGGSEGRKRVADLFKPCYPMVNEYDDSVFEASVMGAFQDIAQYNMIKEGSMTLSELCAHFKQADKKPIDLLASFLAKTRSGPCLDSKFEGEVNSTVEVLRRTAFDGEASSRQWFYQTCNEFGYFQTTTSKRTPFAALRTLTEANVGLEICKRVFNIDVHPDIASTNTEYGALDITVANVTFPSGTIDPWHVLGVQNHTALRIDSLTPVFIEGTAHCADMYHPSDADTPELQWAHARIAENVAQYLDHTVGPFPAMAQAATTTVVAAVE